MKRSKQTKKALTSSVLALVLCFVMLLGTTFAWFTDTASTGVSTIQAGTLDIALEKKTDDGWVALDKGEVLSFVDKDGNNNILWEPGATYNLQQVRVTNVGNLALKYKVVISGINGSAKLNEAIDWTIQTTGKPVVTSEVDTQDAGEEETYYELDGEHWLAPNESAELIISGTMKKEANNDYQGLSIDGVAILVEATQYTYESDSKDNRYDKDATYGDLWDGTADTTWYNDTDTSFKLETAEDLAGLAQLVNGGNDFDGKTVTLASSVDLSNNKQFTPIGTYSNPFEGTFDGGGYTVSNQKLDSWTTSSDGWGSYGLFGTVDGATIQNLTVSDSLIETQGKNSAMVAGIAKGSCTFENITVASGVVANYNNATGGIVGWTDGAGTFTFKNITIGEDAIVATLWKSYDSTVGGIVGEATAGATYIFENVNVACRLDVYNDVCSNYRYYNYRYAGMLIGYLAETTNINGANYPDTSRYNITCNNVTVTYGDWANYHYCQTNTNAKGQRLENNYDDGPGYTHTDHSACLSHNCALIEFDQLFGGKTGVKGIASYDGVTVVYNNK